MIGKDQLAWILSGKWDSTLLTWGHRLTDPDFFYNIPAWLDVEIAKVRKPRRAKTLRLIRLG